MPDISGASDMSWEKADALPRIRLDTLGVWFRMRVAKVVAAAETNLLRFVGGSAQFNW
jgi:hypothetical protein